MTAIERIELEPAYVLHVSPHRETSLRVDALTLSHGRVSAVANGARRPRSRWSSILQPFQPLLLSWSGRGTLFTLRRAEPSAPPIRLTGDALMAGYYVNELVLALTHRGDPHGPLFAHYGSVLPSLARAKDDEIERELRQFELTLLAELGFGLILDHDVVGDCPLDPQQRYRYEVDRGPVPVGSDESTGLVLTGAELIALAEGRIDTSAMRRQAKRVLRATLDRRLGGRTLKTRAVYASLQRTATARV